MTKFCPKCKTDRLRNNFQSNRARHDGLTVYCKDCMKIIRESKADQIKINNRNYYVNNKEKCLHRRREYILLNQQKIRLNRKIILLGVKQELFNLLGKSCNMCGETEIEFLTTDHIKGDNKHIDKSNLSFRKKIINDPNRDKLYQTLCYNCNWSKHVKSKPYRVTHDLVGTKKCATCHKELSKLMFNKSKTRPDGLWSNCKSCVSDYAFNIKIELIAFLGGKCICCGVTDPYKLNVDHVNNDGHRRRSEGWGTTIYLKIIRGKLDKFDYQILCANCNISKFLGNGQCIHERNKNVTCSCGSMFQGKIPPGHIIKCPNYEPKLIPPCVCGHQEFTPYKMKIHRKSCNLWISRNK